MTSEIYKNIEAEVVAKNSERSNLNRLKTIHKYLKIIKESQMRPKNSLSSSSSLFSKQIKATEHSKRTKWAIIVGLLVVFSLLGFYLFAIIPFFTLKNNKRVML
jgi:hypothetical protein